jgi:hypothetical protein
MADSTGAVTTDRLVRAELPRFSDGDMWVARIEAARAIASRDDLTAAEALERIGRCAAPGMTAEAVRVAYENLRDSIKHLENLESDDFDVMTFDPENRDLERLVNDAKDDIEHHLRAIVGRRPRRSS